MKYTKANLSLEKGLKKEWIITNGIGGYASSTILGANTRKYHGLLVAPLNPPANRNLILSKVDECIEIEGKKHDLYTSIGKNYIIEGYKKLQSFEKSFMPIFTYSIGNVQVKKIICMQHEKNTVVIMYRIKTSRTPVKLILTPILNFRDFHTVNENHQFRISQKTENLKTTIILDNQITNPIHIKASEGKYIEHQNDMFKNMYYYEEEKRGFPAEENHAIPGRYEAKIPSNEIKDITFICSLENDIDDIEVEKVISEEVTRLNEIIYDSALQRDGKKDITDEKYLEMVNNYIIASDNFVIKRKKEDLHSIIAGYHWFLDWGRDTLISFEGLLLIPRRFEIARDVLKFMVKDIKNGLIPNGYSEYDNSPLYNSADSSLLLFEQVKKYIKYTNDRLFIKTEIYPSLVEIIENYKKGISLSENNIFMDSDGLISSGTAKTQNTWMDAKCNGIAITPRNGKAVEINSLWYNALKIMEELTSAFKDSKNAKEYKLLAKKCQESFQSKFYNSKRKCLYDVIGDSRIRPNQLLALSLSFPVIDPSSQEARNIIKVVEDKLLNDYGLKTLAKGEENYTEVYEGDSKKRDMSYHQGITWPWLLGLYFDSIKNMEKHEKDKSLRKEYTAKINQFKEKVKNTFLKEIIDGATVGSIAELYDSKKPHQSKGAIAQAWSVAEVYRIILTP